MNALLNAFCALGILVSPAQAAPTSPAMEWNDRSAEVAKWLDSIDATQVLHETTLRIIALSGDKKIRFFDTDSFQEEPRSSFVLPTESDPKFLVETGTNICWLDGGFIRCGYGPYGAEYSKFPAQVNNEPLVNPRDLVTDQLGSLCAITGEKIRCWGKLAGNRLLTSLKNPRKLFYGGYPNICAIDGSNMIVCANEWNERYDLLELKKTPVEDVAWAYGTAHFCGITLKKREVICIGDNRWRQAEPGFSNPDRLFIDNNNTYMIRDGKLSVKGSHNFRGEWIKLPEMLGRATRIFTGYGFGCAKEATRGFSCWGTAFGDWR